MTNATPNMDTVSREIATAVDGAIWDTNITVEWVANQKIDFIAYKGLKHKRGKMTLNGNTLSFSCFGGKAKVEISQELANNIIAC